MIEQNIIKVGWGGGGGGEELYSKNSSTSCFLRYSRDIREGEGYRYRENFFDSIFSYIQVTMKL